MKPQTIPVIVAIIGAAAVIIAALIAALIPVLIPHDGDHIPTPTPPPPSVTPAPDTTPPPFSVITNLMDQEAQAAVMHKPEIVTEIFAQTAVVIDEACLPGKQKKSWHGLQEIMDRYAKLPTFASLKHNYPLVIWMPDDSSAVTATATSETDGLYLDTTSGKWVPAQGFESWEFAKVDGKWLITSFTYDRCSRS